MTTNQYRNALDKLGLTQAGAAEFLGVSIRTSHGYANGEPIPEGYAKLLRLMVARSDAMLKDVRRLLVRCHDRIHSLPRTSDTELATSIEQLLGRIASELGAPHNG